MLALDSAASRLATRLAFWTAGFLLAAWAPLIPLVKARLVIDDGVLGQLLLCIGIGSVIAMLNAGALCARLGCRAVMVASGALLAAVLPLLMLAPSVLLLAFALLVFGMALGALDVTMNIYAVEVERAAARPLMSGFHALFSVGGFMGAALMTLLLSRAIAPLMSVVLCAVVGAVAVAVQFPNFINLKPATPSGPAFSVPRGAVRLLAVLAAIMFLIEGALLDWSALLMTGTGLARETEAGLGYVLFSLAMLVGRLTGDAVSTRWGDRAVLFWGGVVALIGFVVLLAAPVQMLALLGFVLIGAGASNIVPVLFRRAGAQHGVSTTAAVAAVTTAGYAGHLVGPAVVGMVSKATSLPVAFGCLAVLLCAVPLCARRVMRAQ